MSIVLRPAANRRLFILALLATTAAATLLGGCMRTGIAFGDGHHRK